MDSLMLIDGYAQIYRGFYAIRHLSSPDGQPTNAIFALAKFFLNLERDYPSDYGIVAMDIGKPAFRMELAPDYKANRPPMPDELKSQIPLIRELIGLFGWPIVEHKDYEADDIIAALAVNRKEVAVKILSHDKDIAQVVDDRVVMLIPDRASKGLKVQGTAEVIERFSVKPEQIVDYLSLIGDSSDNIPGVQGVGPKTAAKLIHQFGSIDNMMANLDQVSNAKLQEKLRHSQEILKKNVALVTLKTDIAPLPCQDLQSLKKAPMQTEALLAFAEKYSLKSIAKELTKLLKVAPAAAPEQEAPVESNSEEKFTPDLFG